jgi:hypothetical protein
MHQSLCRQQKLMMKLCLRWSTQGGSSDFEEFMARHADTGDKDLEEISNLKIFYQVRHIYQYFFNYSIVVSDNLSSHCLLGRPIKEWKSSVLFHSSSPQVR